MESRLVPVNAVLDLALADGLNSAPLAGAGWAVAALEVPVRVGKEAVVCDAVLFSGLDALTEQPPPDRLRALLAEAWERKSDVLVPALVCAECCRGAGRTRAVESSLARHRENRAARPAVRVVPTDFDLARRVGSVLHGSGADTRDIVDAHSVAVASMHGRAVVVTADPDDILRLASALPAVRIVTRSARLAATRWRRTGRLRAVG